MTSWYNRRMFSRGLASLFAFCLCSLFLGCHRTPHANEILKPTVCDLRERPDEFGGKVIQVSGWIYSDIERFGLEEPNCAIPLRWPENKAKPSDTQLGKFTNLLKASRKNPFETDGQLFTIVQGKFETAMVRKNGQLVMSGSGYGGGAGSAPSILTIQEVVCSVVAPLSSTTKGDAAKRCQE
jgi:hypothetical protein